MMFSGSYRRDDVRILMTPVPVEMVGDVSTKEFLIQTGQRHYSEMLSPEQLPSQSYRDLFFEATAANKARMARDCMDLALAIRKRRAGVPALVSLARAGTPVGVIVKHLLSHVLGDDVVHFSVSIIRDRGIDFNALDAILACGHRPEDIVFIDGWTGKGVITHELHKAVEEYNASRKVKVSSELFVLADLAGVAAFAATDEDYLIPSSIMNATVSGLVSRSVLNEHVGHQTFHGCVFYSAPTFRSADVSVWFVEEILEAWRRGNVAAPSGRIDAKRSQAKSVAFIRRVMVEHKVMDANLIKPGIGEATRALLRRKPERLILRDSSEDRVKHLVELAHEKEVAITIDESLPYYATAIIRSALHG